MAYSESKSGGSGVGTIVGFLVGVGVGLLFATRPGSETRQQIADLFKKGREKGEDLISQGREKISDTMQSGAQQQGGKEPFYESGKYT